jgi:hypothetical protein
MNANQIRRARVVPNSLFSSMLDSCPDLRMQRESQGWVYTARTLELVPGYRVKRVFLAKADRDYLCFGDPFRGFDAGQTGSGRFCSFRMAEASCFLIVLSDWILSWMFSSFSSARRIMERNSSDLRSKSCGRREFWKGGVVGSCDSFGQFPNRIPLWNENAGRLTKSRTG